PVSAHLKRLGSGKLPVIGDLIKRATTLPESDVSFLVKVLHALGCHLELQEVQQALLPVQEAMTTNMNNVVNGVEKPEADLVKA
ncbi:hypothetical protein NDU88_011479, partial [Pleurodeles waltl]